MSSDTAQRVAEILNTPIPFLAVLDRPIPALEIFDTNININWDYGLQAFQSVRKIPSYIPKIQIPQSLLDKFSRAERSRIHGPTRFTLTGKISRGVKTKFALDGQDIIIDGRTWVIGNLEIGCQAQGRGKISPDGFWSAEKIVVNESFDA